MLVEGKLLIRSDGVRLLLSPYRQQLAEGKGSTRRVQAQVHALSKETGFGFGTVRQLRDGSSEALLGSEHDCYPAGEIVSEALGGHERVFFAEEIAPGKFVVIAVDDRRVVMDEISNSEDELLNNFTIATTQFGDRPFTLAVNQAVLDGMPLHSFATVQLLEESVIETAAVPSALKFRSVGQIGAQAISKGKKKAMAIAAVVAAAASGGWYHYSSIEAQELAEQMAMLSAMKNRTIDPLADYRRAMDVTSADTFIGQLDVLVFRASRGQGWIPNRLDFTNGERLKIGLESFGGTRQDLIKQVQIPNAVYAQGPEGTVLLVDIAKLPRREHAPKLQPLTKVLFETLDALDANSMGVLKVQTGEIASFGRWNSQKIQVNVERAPLSLIKLLSKALEGRPVNLTQAELSLEKQSLSGVIHLDVFGE
jgi:hypothetical protein